MAFTTSWFRQASLYKFRFVFGYGVIIIFLLFMVTADIGSLPNGLSQAEMNQAVAGTSTSLNPTFDWTINGAYNFVQQLSISQLGLSRLSLVLPSLIFGILTIVVFALTMQKWFKDRVAIVSTVIVMTSMPFITMIRSATPDIMLPFWTMLLIYGAVRLLVKREHAFYWKLLIVISSLGLLYTPYGIYPLIAIFTSSLFHPHVRSRLRHIKRFRIIILASIAAVGIIPLAIYLATHHNALNTLTGIDIIRDSLTHFRKNLATVFDLYLNVRKNGFSLTQVIPLYSVATLALVVLGLLKSIKERYTARSYVLLTWALVTFLTVLFMPYAVSLVFAPVSLLVAIGIDTLVLEWYKLFPRNPYARVAGLIPLTILFLGIGWGNIGHYFNNHNHIPNPFYNQSLAAIQRSLVIEGDHAVILVTNPKDEAFYRILARKHRYLTVTTTLPTSTDTPTFVLPDATKTFPIVPSRIVTTSTKDNSVALRIYRPQ